jgi:Domain of unknown function (DUF4397)
MVTRMKLGLMMAVLLLAAACSHEPKQTQPVTSTSGSGTSTAAPAKEVAARNNALVRVINAVPGKTAFDVFADDQKVFESVAFKSVTPYKELPDTHRAFRVRPAGQDTAQPVAENSEGLAGGKHYTIVVMPDTNDKAALHIVNDNIDTPPANKAQVRVIHAAPDVGEIDVVEKQGNKTLFSGVNFERETAYMDVDPMKTTLEVKQEGQQQPILTLPNANFEKSKFYTIVVTGLTKGAPKLQTLMVEDQLGSAPTASAPSQDPKMQKTKASRY